MVSAMAQDADVRLPGARRHAGREKSHLRGIDVPEALLSELRKLASA
jgi:(2R)-3-sulfolactate dehydrogenase (NADP+)